MTCVCAVRLTTLVAIIDEIAFRSVCKLIIYFCYYIGRGCCKRATIQNRQVLCLYILYHYLQATSTELATLPFHMIN